MHQTSLQGLQQTPSLKRYSEVRHFISYPRPEKFLHKLESIQRRFFWGFKEDSKGISWVKWESVMCNKESGGLGIESLKAKNLGLIGKWRWRFHEENNALWRKVVIALHGVDGGFDSCYGSGLLRGIWATILSSSNAIDKTGVPYSKSFCHKVGNGTNIRLWEDVWSAHGRCLKDVYPRLYTLELNKNCPE